MTDRRQRSPAAGGRGGATRTAAAALASCILAAAASCGPGEPTPPAPRPAATAGSSAGPAAGSADSPKGAAPPAAATERLAAFEAIEAAPRGHPQYRHRATGVVFVQVGDFLISRREIDYATYAAVVEKRGPEQIRRIRDVLGEAAHNIPRETWQAFVAATGLSFPSRRHLAQASDAGYDLPSLAADEPSEGAVPLRPVFELGR